MQPYKFSIVKKNYFEFTTTAGISYACFFISYADYFKDFKEVADSIYSVNLEVLGKNKHNVALDERTGLTIVEILKSFLSKLEEAVVYVCDNSDGRELLRKRKFDIWFRKYDDGTIIKVDGHIVIPNFDIYNAILIHKDNPNKNRFIEVFTELNETSNEK
ncbi:MAG: hypothetical protein K2X48_16650 [Chitinophagaceae bacterium]|nr:hypothetical protein [Chitinophagaceae bacterium]